ncbi:MAG: hypothetical protein ACR2NO_12040 [Chloroflexota bacterium]
MSDTPETVPAAERETKPRARKTAPKAAAKTVAKVIRATTTAVKLTTAPAGNAAKTSTKTGAAKSAANAATKTAARSVSKSAKAATEAKSPSADKTPPAEQRDEFAAIEKPATKRAARKSAAEPETDPGEPVSPAPESPPADLPGPDGRDGTSVSTMQSGGLPERRMRSPIIRPLEDGDRGRRRRRQPRGAERREPGAVSPDQAGRLPFDRFNRRAERDGRNDGGGRAPRERVAESGRRDFGGRGGPSPGRRIGPPQRGTAGPAGGTAEWQPNSYSRSPEGYRSLGRQPQEIERFQQRHRQGRWGSTGTGMGGRSDVYRALGRGGPPLQGGDPNRRPGFGSNGGPGGYNRGGPGGYGPPSGFDPNRARPARPGGYGAERSPGGAQRGQGVYGGQRGPSGPGGPGPFRADVRYGAPGQAAGGRRRRRRRRPDEGGDAYNELD